MIQAAAGTASRTEGERRAKRPREVLRSQEPVTESWTPWKKRNLRPAWSQIDQRPSGPAAPRLGAKEKDRVGSKDNLPSGNLDFADYKWWIGAQVPASVYAMCRGCREQVYSRDGMLRRLHHDHYRCTLLIAEASVITQKSRVCTLCEKSCGKMQRWGVALCGEECMRHWMFWDQPSPLWLRALALARPKVEDKMLRGRREFEKTVVL